MGRGTHESSAGWQDGRDIREYEKDEETPLHAAVDVQGGRDVELVIFRLSFLAE